MISLRNEKYNNGCRGAILVEATIVIPLLIIVVIFLIEIIRFSVVAFVASEAEVATARMLSLPPSPSDQDSELISCSKLVGGYLEEKSKLFYVPITPEDYKVYVKVINNQRAEMNLSVSSRCVFCISELGGDMKLTREIFSDIKLEAGVPRCEPDEWEYRA